MNTSFIKLPYRFMHIHGPDAEKFLQGQCSIDVTELADDEYSFGTFNDAKGRMYCLFKACRYNDGILLSLHESLYDHTLSILTKYKVFFKCEIKDLDLNAYGSELSESNIPKNNAREDNVPEDKGLEASTEVSSLLNSLADHTFATAGKCCGLRLPNSNLIELWLSKDTELASVNDASEWMISLCKAGVPHLDDRTKEKFILQDLNLQELGAVSFKKGCYTGQEIIARMKYLGKQKKRMYLLESEEMIEASPLDRVIDVDGKKLGMIVCGAKQEKLGSYYLAVLNTELVDGLVGAYLDESEQHLSIKHLDYEI